MTSPNALAKLWERTDGNFFRQHPDRFFHIRNAYVNECQGEFWSLGDHDRSRRRILLCRADHRMQPLPDNKVMKIPFLAFSDESIGDTDDVLFPICRDIMLDALRKETLKR